MSALILDFDCVSVIVGLLLSGEGVTLETLSALSDFGPDWAEGVADLTENRPVCCVNRTVNEAFTVRSLADAALLADWLVSGGRWQKTDSTTVYAPENIPEAERAGLNFVRLGGGGGGGAADPAESKFVIRLITDLCRRGVTFRGVADLERTARELAANGSAEELRAFEANLVARLFEITEGRDGAMPHLRRRYEQIDEALGAHQERAAVRHLREIGVI